MPLYLVTEPEPECEFPEAIGDDYSDDDMPDMGGVSQKCLGYVILFVIMLKQ